MSHALVLIATEKFPTNEIIQDTMLPYHKYESTGIEEYVIDIDVTEECIKEFEEYKERNKDILDVYNSLEEHPYVYNSLEEYATDYNDYIYIEDDDGKFTIYHHTNPNAKWDYYEIGGKYDNYLTCVDGDFNILKKKDINFELKKDRIRNTILKNISLLKEIIGDKEIPSLDKLIEEYGLSKGREMYYNNEVVKSIPSEYHFMFSTSIENVLKDKEIYINKRYVGVPFAIIYNRVWYEKSELGVFTIAKNEKEDWGTEFFNIWNNIPDDYWITVIDYHI